MDTFTTILLWVVGAIALAAASTKLLTPGERMTSDPKLAWVQRQGLLRARVAGAAELSASVAIIGTAAGIDALDSGKLAGVAAVGLVVISAFAVNVHRGHEPVIPPLLMGVPAMVLAIMLLAV